MPIDTINNIFNPAFGLGALYNGAVQSGEYYYPEGGTTGQVIELGRIEQVVGMVPVFPCDNVECRVFTADYMSDETKYPLPVFASLTDDLDYHNDINSWLFNAPMLSNSSTTYEFWLQKLVNGVWTDYKHLNDSSAGIFYDLQSLCEGLLWKGYLIRWKQVLALYGAGMYRFKVVRTVFGIVINPADPDYPIIDCYASPPFCLQEWDCDLANRTVKFEQTFQGGRFGSVDKTNCGGKSWDFCCVHAPDPIFPAYTSPITWYDSIRVFGFFGREEFEYERKQIKYQHGQINKIRDEAISKFKFKSFGNSAANPGGGYPQWLNERLAVYGFMADLLTVSDYNKNNGDYNLKQYCIVADGNLVPVYKNGSRYAPISMDFKSGVQYKIRTRCC